MKTIVILSFVYLISAHPVELPAKLSGKRLQMMEQEILNHLSELVLALKSDDIPKSVDDLSLPQLNGCITTKQRGLIKTCIFKSHCILKLGSASTIDCSKMEIPTDEGQEDVSPDVTHDATHSIFPMVMECVVGTLSPPGMIGFTNVTYLKQGIIDTTSLSELQKTSALPILESCLTSTFTLPEINGMDQLLATISGQGNNLAIATKAMICAAKAILINGCAIEVQTKMAEQQIQANVATASNTGSAELGKKLVDGNPPACNGTHPMETPNKSSG